MRRRLLHRALCFVLLLCWQMANAQDSFRYSAEIPVVSKTGLYAINLDPKIVASCQPGLQDLRIFDEDKQVGYVIREDKIEIMPWARWRLPLLVNKLIKPNKLSVVVKNPARDTLFSMQLIVEIIPGYSVQVSGSNDSKTWHLIKSEYHKPGKIDPLQSVIPDSIVKNMATIECPATTYRFVQFVIESASVFYPNFIVEASTRQIPDILFYQELPSPAFKQVDSNNQRTYLWLAFDRKYEIEYLRIIADGPKLFRREALLYEGAQPEVPIDQTIIKSDTFYFTLKPVRADSFLLVIQNDDNQPLRIREINASQVIKKLFVHLEANKHYVLFFGNSKIRAPKYDLEFFLDSMKVPVDTLQLSPVKEYPSNNEIRPMPRSSKISMWIIIGAVLVALLFFTLRLTKEINKRKD